MERYLAELSLKIKSVHKIFGSLKQTELQAFELC